MMLIGNTHSTWVWQGQCLRDLVNMTEQNRMVYFTLDVNIKQCIVLINLFPIRAVQQLPVKKTSFMSDRHIGLDLLRGLVL